MIFFMIWNGLISLINVMKNIDKKNRTMYHIIPITSFDEAKKYAPHCDWCICKAEFDYETYTLHGETFYFCLREGFAETPKAVGDNHPLDEYGLSMLAVSVTPDGRLANFTNRWNEDRIGNPIVSEQEISEIIGRDFREVFKPIVSTSHNFDNIPALTYTNSPQADNPNMTRGNGEWLKLKRHNRDEVLQMLINPEDILSLTGKDMPWLLNYWSTDYRLWFINAKGDKPLQQCIEYIKKVDVLCGYEFHHIKIWLAPGEKLSAEDLRQFNEEMKQLKRWEFNEPVFAIGQGESLQIGEVRMMMLIYYCDYFYEESEIEWRKKKETLPISRLKDEIPCFRKVLAEQIRNTCKKMEINNDSFDMVFRYNFDNIFQENISKCISGLEYYEEQSWEQAQEALEFFLALGSPIQHALYQFLLQARKYLKQYMKKETPDNNATLFFLKAALWALEKGDTVHEFCEQTSSLNILHVMMKRSTDSAVNTLLYKIEAQMLERGAKTYREMEKERENNTDYFKELEYICMESMSGRKETQSLDIKNVIPRELYKDGSFTK